MTPALTHRLEFPPGGARYPGRHEVLDAVLRDSHGNRIAVVVKKASLDWRQRLTGRTRADRAMATARHLMAAGIDTPEPLAAETVGEESWFVARRLEGATQVRAWFRHRADPIRAPAPPGALSFEDVVRGVGALARKVHDAGVFFRDFTDGNILVTLDGGSPRFWLVDLDRAVLRRRVGVLARLRDLARPGLNDYGGQARLLGAYFGPEGRPPLAGAGVALLRARIRVWDRLKQVLRPWRP